ncbi:hypothetical protein D9757_013200 [Collybiopsis confluens]|uniref:Uncharacterized protein n=1 Tax=Collybiopsis confluens TaxID=2823264 RepID=A0A8H5G1N3_9AGAR|nr:hypothetical protein D9757_013200 [Collybiopsis confluens]
MRNKETEVLSNTPGSTASTTTATNPDGSTILVIKIDSGVREKQHFSGRGHQVSTSMLEMYRSFTLMQPLRMVLGGYKRPVSRSPVPPQCEQRRLPNFPLPTHATPPHSDLGIEVLPANTVKAKSEGPVVLVASEHYTCGKDIPHGVGAAKKDATITPGVVSIGGGFGKGMLVVGSLTGKKMAIMRDEQGERRL